ncbi:hypothetical protein [Paraburkholderia lacunae]|uniref:hypothetical protein n=1 Tax=Paraburkholderia lacunae TaxID=2211104 RepID=UPI0014028487|nr:hypothetical protein [Paraburkholderia lacunae]
MTLQPLLDELGGLLEVDAAELTRAVKLDTFENWDSLTKVTLLGFVEDHYRVALDAALLDRLTDVGSLLDALTASLDRAGQAA